MIKGNQKLLNLFRILIDTAIIVFSFIRAYYLRFSNDSILIRWEWIEEPVGIYGSSDLLVKGLHANFDYADSLLPRFLLFFPLV